MSKTVNIPVQGRSCEGCAMCCKLGAIAEVNKPDGEWCTHCTSRTGCDIYDTRPAVCRDYYCFYMLSDLSEDWRPTKAKLMVSLMRNGSVYISVDRTRPDAWKHEPYFSMIKQWSGERRLIVMVGLMAYGVYPDRIDKLGMLTPGYALTGQIEQTPSGPVERTIRVEIPPSA